MYVIRDIVMRQERLLSSPIEKVTTRRPSPHLLTSTHLTDCVLIPKQSNANLSQHQR